MAWVNGWEGRLQRLDWVRKLIRIRLAIAGPRVKAGFAPNPEIGVRSSVAGASRCYCDAPARECGIERE